MTIQEKVLQLAARPTGVGSNEVMGCTVVQVGHAARNLVDLGRLFVARLSHKNARYFTTEPARDAFLAHRLRTVRVRANPAPVTIPMQWDETTPTQESPGVKVTICPGYVPRFQPIVVPGAPRVFHGSTRLA
jgi:hypothetical protein